MFRDPKFLRIQGAQKLEVISARSGLTRSYLSKVERGLSNSSIASALKIEKALGVTERLFGQNVSSDGIEINRASKGIAGDPASYLSMVAGLQHRRTVRPFLLRPGQKESRRSAAMDHHQGEQILFVVRAAIELRLGKKHVEMLRKGDCVHFDASIPHKPTASIDGTVEALVVIVDPQPISARLVLSRKNRRSIKQRD